MIRIITDSSCDLPSEVLERQRIAVVPVTIRFGEDTYVDGESLDRSDFWDRIASGEPPEVEAPSAERFRDAFIRLEAEGADGIVCLTGSGAVRGTHAAAEEAARGFRSGVPVAVVDSGLTSGALGLAVLATADAARSMAPVHEIDVAARRAAAACGIVVSPDGTRHARRMKRLGPVRSLLSRWLVRHFLVSMSDGGFAPAGRVKSRGAALDALAAAVEEVGPSAVAVVHAGAPEVDALLERLEGVTDADPMVVPMGPALGAMMGPGAVAVATRASG